MDEHAEWTGRTVRRVYCKTKLWNKFRTAKTNVPERAHDSRGKKKLINGDVTESQPKLQRSRVRDKEAAVSGMLLNSWTNRLLKFSFAGSPTSTSRDNSREI